MTEIIFKNLQKKGDVVKDGDALANTILQLIEDDSHVQVSFVDMRGLPSSFFNVLLKRLRESDHGPQVFDKIDFIFDSNAQKDIFSRSKERVLGCSAA